MAYLRSVPSRILIHPAAEHTGRKITQKNRNLRTIAQLCPANVFATKACIDNKLEKNLLSGNLLHCLHNMVSFGPLTAEIRLRVWGTPANFNRFRVLASLPHRRRSTQVNKTLQDVWPSPALVHYI